MSRKKRGSSRRFYHNKQEERYFVRWWFLVLGLVVTTVIVFGVLNYIGVIGQTAVERSVFENSYQYQAGQDQKIATYEAQLAEIKHQLALMLFNLLPL